MRTSAVTWSLIAGLLSTTVPLHAQRVEAGVVVRSGPVAGHVVIRDGYSTYRRTYRRPTARRVVVVERPRIVVVERAHRHRHAKHWVRRGYRPVTLYYWDGRYYDRWAGDRYGVRTIVVWERDGRYYQDHYHDHRDHDCEDDRRSHDDDDDWDD